MNKRAIQRYVAHAPKAISGNNGHTTTLKVARTLHNGFGLCGDELLHWLGVYNARLSDQWTDRELEHKAEAAESSDYDKPRGWMLDPRQFATPTRFTIQPANNAANPPAPCRRYVLTPDTTDVFYSNSFIRARTHAQRAGESEISVVSVEEAVVPPSLEATEVPDLVCVKVGNFRSDPLIAVALEVFKTGVADEWTKLQSPPTLSAVAVAEKKARIAAKERAK
ncbi:MAG: hypothetical protein ACJ8NS_03100 [Chthoniobacterales bacterium]